MVKQGKKGSGFTNSLKLIGAKLGLTSLIATIGIYATRLQVWAKKEETTAASANVAEGGRSYNFDFFSQIDSFFYGIGMDIITFSTVAALVCSAVCLLTLIFTKNERATEMSWSWLKRILICYVVLVGLVSVIGIVGGLKIFQG